MKGQKLKQFGLILCVTLSLLVSSLAACACSHHESVTVAEAAAVESSTSCHSSPVAEDTDSGASRETKSDENVQTGVSSGNCFCFESAAPKVFAKSENVKVEKQIAAFTAPPQSIINWTVEFVSVKTIDFAPPFYLSDSFHNLTPGRAPPARL